MEENKAGERTSIACSSLSKNHRWYFIPEQNIKYEFAWEL